MFEWASWDSSNDLFLELCDTREDLENLSCEYLSLQRLYDSYHMDFDFLRHKIAKLEQTIIALDGVNSELRFQIDKLKNGSQGPEWRD
jgi:hypothetical protein